eukprot:237128-Amorphochlora_amoeboformis.AAC.2
MCGRLKTLHDNLIPLRTGRGCRRCSGAYCFENLRVDHPQVHRGSDVPIEHLVALVPLERRQMRPHCALQAPGDPAFSPERHTSGVKAEVFSGEVLDDLDPAAPRRKIQCVDPMAVE